VIRGAFTNPVANQPVELYVGTDGTGPRRSTTNNEGRAEFTGIEVGSTVRAAATVDGLPLQSQAFPVPSLGGVRVMLVAGLEGNAAPYAGPADAASGPPDQVTGTKTSSTTSRTAAVLLLLSASGLVVFAGRRKRSSPRRAVRAAESSVTVPDRDTLFGRLIELEERHEAHQIPESTYRVEREALMRRLEKLDSASSQG
jgi:hypothetical protein